MADFTWLRVGQRPRTPSTPKSPRRPDHGPPRKPSLLSLNTHASSSPEPSTGSSDASLLVRDQDRIWYNPSLDQMVEVLQVQLMTHGVLEPVPVRYNSYILHLIEGFADAQERVRAVHAARAGAEQSLEKHLEHFRSVAEEWLEREAQYKAEIKRLEVLLSKASSDGLEAVTLARTNSVVDRSGPQAKQFVSELKRISIGTLAHETPLNTTRGMSKRESIPRPTGVTKGGSLLEHHRPYKSKGQDAPFSHLDDDHDFLVSEKIRQQDVALDLSNPHPGVRRSRRSRAIIPKLSGDALPAKRGAEPSIGSTRDKELRPLFSDDIHHTSDTSDEVELKLRESTTRRMQPSRRILENLLGCEKAPGDDSKNVHPPPRNGTRPSSEHGSYRVSKGTTTHALDSRHLRNLSGFSFVPGDDALTASTGDGRSSDMQATVPGRDGDSRIETWQYERIVSQHEEEDSMKSWDTQSSASSVDTVILTCRETTVPAAHHGSLAARRTDTPLLQGRNKMPETNLRRMTSGDGTRNSALGRRREAREDDTSV